MAEPPPPPPPHGSNPRPPGGLPDGNYDIFIVPPHSAGAGFLYLPSLQTHRNSFIAGIAVALVSVGIYTIVTPVLKAWLATVMAGNAWGVLLLVVIVGVGAWAFGKTSGESSSTGGGNANNGTGNGQRHGFSWGSTNAPPPPPHSGAPPHTAPPPQPGPAPGPPPQEKAESQTGWEKAREETRKREEARKRAEEFEKKRAEANKAREEAERAAKAKAEKEKWEQARAREREQREREAREKTGGNKSAPAEKEAREKSIRERMEKLRREREERQKAASSPSATGRTSPKKEYVRPTARSAVGTEDQYSYRPYDTPSKPQRTPYHASSASSISGLSDSSYAASQTTAQTTPPASHRGPYSTKDPDKILIRAVYLINDSFPTRPVAQLIVGQGNVTDGLILNIRTEGLFIDDDVRKIPQREWDVKAWTLKLVEDGSLKGAVVGGQGLHVLRATVRNAENSKYCFVLDETEGWKVAIGLQRLRKGSQVRSLGMSGMKENEVKGLLGALGWL